MLQVFDITHGYGDKLLYRQAGFQLFRGEHIGIVGQNGSGKSTLLGILLGHIVPDEGRVVWQSGLKIAYLDQHASVPQAQLVLPYLRTAFDDLYETEKRMLALYEQAASDDAALDEAAALQEELDVKGFYTLDSEIEKVANGLGIAALGMQTPLGQLSGGQRAKVLLAKLLLQQADVLLMDEPTNFLDVEHISWLTGYLAGFAGAYLIVSHDTSFLEGVTTGILDIEFGSITKYNGKHSQFIHQKKHLREDYVRRYNAQQQYIQRTEEYIRRNIAGVHTKNARGRRKQLERLDRLDAPGFTQPPKILFECQPVITDKVLQLCGLEVGYSYPLLPPVSLTVAGAQKVVVKGFNGIGKSTLMKTIVGLLPALGGRFTLAPGVVVGYYGQDLAWPYPSLTPLQIVQQEYPWMNTKLARRALAGMGIKKEHVENPIGSLSGGEQSKVKLCLLLQQKANLLVLDEPTNHLDAGTKEVLREALAKFAGAVLLVSHEPTFYKDIADKVLDMSKMG